MIRIPLYKTGKYALVDECDAHLALLAWHENRVGRCSYAVHITKERKNVYLHRAVMGISEHVDHISGDGLDCRRANLRPATKSQNGANSPIGQRNRSGFKGVHWNPDNRNWRARIVHHGKSIEVGSFATAEDAARAYDAAVRERFGEFACVNFPVGGERPARVAA